MRGDGCRGLWHGGGGCAKSGGSFDLRQWPDAEAWRLARRARCHLARLHGHGPVAPQRLTASSLLVSALWHGQVGQNGKSATLTAPNGFPGWTWPSCARARLPACQPGISQEEVIWKAIREAAFSCRRAFVRLPVLRGQDLSDRVCLRRSVRSELQRLRSARADCTGVRLRSCVWSCHGTGTSLGSFAETLLLKGLG